MASRYTVALERTGIGDVAQVGGKNASLGEMLAALSDRGIRVPGGFATTAQAYRHFLTENRLEQPIATTLDRYKDGGLSLAKTGKTIRGFILDATLPDDLKREIEAGYDALAETIGAKRPAVAVRSSATAEDLPGASFAGQQETFLNIRGKPALLDSCRRCFASLFTDRAISYRETQGFGHLDVALSIGVQQMVRADKAGAGVMFSIDTETGFPGAIVISAAWGLGETVVQGAVDPDKYVVFKPLLDNEAARPILEKTLGSKRIKLIHARGDNATRMVDTKSGERRTFVLGDDEILELARWGAIIETHYDRPMDMEWAKDGVTGELFIVQARPETVQAAKTGAPLTVFRLTQQGTRLVTGSAVGTAIAAGQACVVHDTSDIADFRDGAILVAERTDPDWVPIMKRAAGIVTDHGGATSHAAIVSRELGVPAIVGTGTATKAIADGRVITLSCAEGERGAVYDGLLAFEREEIDLDALPQTETAVMVNLADPEAAFRWWRLPAKGVGLARMEFIINTAIGVHPMALAHPERLSREDRRKIKAITQGYADPTEFFVDRLARGIAKLAAPYWPHPAIVRLSDFKTNEYAHLIGGALFEPHEENPMLGFRGASRYYDPRYRDGFALECRALTRVREEIGLANVVVMIPFCRTPAEADKVLAEMAGHGLKRGEEGLEIYMMCEIPSNVVLAEKFATRFDGFSIGSNDLTQLVLGVDRDSDLLAPLFDERDEAVERMIAEVIAKAQRAGVKTGLCGQAPSDHPDFAAFLVGLGIDSISLNPDSFVTTIKAIAAAKRHGAARPKAKA